jgi:hypothetical protein
VGVVFAVDELQIPIIGSEIGEKEGSSLCIPTSEFEARTSVYRDKLSQVHARLFILTLDYTSHSVQYMEMSH